MYLVPLQKRSVYQWQINKQKYLQRQEQSQRRVQAFYGVITALLDEVIDINENIDLVSDIAIEITEIIKENDTVDWQNNQTIYNKIAQEIDDMFYLYEKEHGFKVDFDVIDKIIENVITVALRRFK